MSSTVRRPARAVVAVVLVALLVAGVATGLLGGAARRVLSAGGLLVDGGASTLAPSPTGGPSTGTAGSTAAPTGTPSPVLDPLGPARPERRARVADRVEGVGTLGMGGSWSGAVAAVSGGSSSVLYRHRGTDGLIPASTMKLLTSTAALQLLGPDHRFTTEVVTGADGQIVLVGGGDPYLASSSSAAAYPPRSTLARLALDTATALKRSGRTKVRLGYDASLFAGPDWNPHWPATYGDQVTPVSALWVDEGRRNGGSPGPRVQDPADAAATAFATALGRRGIEVTGTGAARARRAARSLASVSSMPLSAVVGETLLHSDNDAAEVLLRQVGLASGHTGSFEGGVAGVQQTLRRLGAWSSGTTLVDGSGLSRDNRVSAEQLVQVIGTAAATDHARLRSLLTGLPTAAVDGSLRYRYDDAAGASGRGVLRAKTGTLSGVHSLAGWTVSRDGSLLVFAFVANDVQDDYASTRWLEHVTAAVAGCGCS